MYNKGKGGGGEKMKQRTADFLFVFETASHDVAVRRTVVLIARPVPEDHGLMRCDAV